MDNKAIANIFYETADLMKVANEDGFRIRSYERAAEALEGWPQQVSTMAEKEVLEIPGIGKSMAANIRQLNTTGKLDFHQQMLQKFHPSMLELLKISGLGPKTIALIWDAFKICDVEGVAKLASEGKLRTLPRLSEKSEQKILKSIENYRQLTGRFLLNTADEIATKMTELLAGLPGVEKVTPAGSLRRGRETVGDLDLLVTGKCCDTDSQRNAVIDRIVSFPGILEVLAKGENKVSFKLRSGMQVDVRLLPPDSFGAAMQYFTGSKNHNVQLRQRAIKQGYTLNEYGLVRVEDKLPELITQADIQGDVHMHTVETDGKCTIEEMALAARERGYKYMAITDHSKNLAFANGLDDKRAEAHIKKIRAASKAIDGITIFAGIEVDILADGELDLSDSVLEQMDIVIASVHSHFNQEPAQMTDRLLRVIANPNTSLMGHPTGRMLLRREGFAFDYDKVFTAAARAGVAMEQNAYPDRLDLRDQHLRMAKAKGVKFIVNTDAHHTSHMEKIRYGVLQLRRAWLTKQDVLNTLPAAEFARIVRRGRPVLAEIA